MLCLCLPNAFWGTCGALPGFLRRFLHSSGGSRASLADAGSAANLELEWRPTPAPAPTLFAARRADAHRPDAMNADKLPRTTAAPHLQSLWRKHDLTDAVVGFLDLNAICSLPALSKSFAAGQLRILCAAGTQAVIKRAIVGGLRDAGRDVVRFRERWDNPVNWCGPTGDIDGTDYGFGEGHVGLAKFEGAESGIQNGGLQLDLDGERNCIKSFRMRCRYCAVSGEINTGGGNFVLMSTDSSQECSERSFLCRVFFQALADGPSEEMKQLIWSVNYAQGIEESVHLCDARLGQWYTIEAEFDWDASTAIVSVDGVRVTRPLRFHRVPLRSLYLGNHSDFTSQFGGIDIDYYAASRQRFEEPQLAQGDSDSGDY